MLDLELLGESSWRGPGGKRKPPLIKRTWFSALVAVMILGVCVAFGVMVFVVRPLREKAETYDMEECKRLEEASVIYDRHGGELGRIHVMNRTSVKLSEVPPHLIKALTSQEDSRFFTHDGVDYLGILRAIWLTVKVGKVTQGASTLTQQLARNTFELREKSIKRKLLEAFVAQRLEKNYTKNEILELYLNRIFFGSGNNQQFYGVQAAARGYFGKDVKDINVEEAATIVGLIKAPNLYSPLRHVTSSIKARNMVFHRMMEEGHLTVEEEEALSRKPMITAIQTMNPRQTYVYDEVARQVKKLIGEERATTGGFNIYTSIDPVLQKAAEESVRKRLTEVESQSAFRDPDDVKVPHQTYDQYRAVLSDWASKMTSKQIDPNTPKPQPTYLQGSALVLDNKDGSVLAVVGGRDYRDSQLNRAFASPRPVGTAFIPLDYAAAFTTPLFFPGTPLTDEPFDNNLAMIGSFQGMLGEWGVEAEKMKFTFGQISARESLVHSRNGTTMRLCYQAFQTAQDKLDYVPLKELAAHCGIESEILERPASFLGTNPARLDEMCLAYTCFANNGSRPAKVHLINKITDLHDNLIFQINEEDSAPVQAMDEVAAAQVHSCLVDALDRGTGAAARANFGLKKFPAAGKTGTHDGFKDLWFLGYTSRVTCGVWVGFDKPKTIFTGAVSSQIALPIWVDIMNASVAGHKPEAFVETQGMVPLEICRKSGHRATDFCYTKVRDADGKERSVRDTFFEQARPGTVFHDFCTEHVGEGIALDLLAFSSPIGKGDIAGVGGSGGIPGVDPVRMQSETVSGEDPYNSLKPVLRPDDLRKDGGGAVKRALKVEDGEGTEEALPVKLPPPTPIKIEG
jgi:penicillin-binding protein 1A